MSPSYGDDLRVAHRTRHSMKKDENPFCPTCGWRTFPLWGSHDCSALRKDELQRIRHTAGDIISNLHFYRVPADFQVEALAEALAFVMAANLHPKHVAAKWASLQLQICNLMQTQLLRQAKGTNAENLVMDVAKPRMTIKTKKERPHARKLQARSTGRRRRR